jgi:serine/threonine protein kinase
LLKVIDVGRDAEDCYVAFEEFPGVLLEDLFELWSKSGSFMPCALVARIGVEIACALAEFQAVYRPRSGRGKLHGDLTLRSVVVTADGSVRIVPPCLSSVVELARREAGSPRLAYKAPEQLRFIGAEAPDARADVFALGVLLWELAAGRRIGGYRPTLKLLGAVAAAQPPALETLRSDVPPAFSRAISACLERSPRFRPSSPVELAEALTEAVPEITSANDITPAAQAAGDQVAV